MELTIQIRRLEDGRYRAEAPELPNVFYEAENEGEARERIERLAHALRSPHIRIERVLPDGDVVLTLARAEGPEDPPEETDECPFTVPGRDFRQPHLMLVG